MQQATLVTTRPLTFLGITTRTSNKSGTPQVFQIAKLGDPVKFENYDFFLNNEILSHFDGLTAGDSVNVNFNLGLRGNQLQVYLASVTKSVPVKS